MGKSAKNKVFLTVNKKKPVHPRSRKAVQINSQFKKTIKAEKKRTQENMKLQVYGVKLAAVHDLMDKSLTQCTAAYLDQLIESYIDRNEDELLEIKSNRFKPSNKHISRELDITYCRKMEREEYDSTGFEMLNLLNNAVFIKFLAWEKDIKSIPSMESKTFLKNSLR